MREPGQVVKAGSWHNAKKWLRLQSFCMTISMGQLIPIVKCFLAVAEFVIPRSHRNAKVSKQSGFYDSSIC
jgi:hypothetical protein